MRNGAVASVLVAVIVVSGGIGYLTGQYERTVTSTSTFSAISTTTTTMSTSLTKYANNSFVFLTASGICGENGSYVPCFGAPPAYVFTACTSLLSGPGPGTCSYVVKSTSDPYPNDSISIMLGVVHEPEEPQWATCQLVEQATAYADCVFINSTSFILGEPASSA
jgi:hypothetical protein